MAKYLSTEQEIKMAGILTEFVVNGHTFVTEIPDGSPFDEAEEMLFLILSNLHKKIKNDGESPKEK